LVYKSSKQQLQIFDARLSKWYVGRSMTSLPTAIVHYGRILANGTDMTKSGAEILATHGGAGGFKGIFLDSRDNMADQTHHFVAFLSAGINDTSTTAYLHMMQDSLQGNEGDMALGLVAFQMGQDLRNNPNLLQQLPRPMSVVLCNP